MVPIPYLLRKAFKMELTESISMASKLLMHLLRYFATERQRRYFSGFLYKDKRDQTFRNLL